jgi:hypothetical protein
MPDGNSVPADIPRIIAKMNDGYDLVIGSRSCARFVRARRPRSPAKKVLRASPSRSNALTRAPPRLRLRNVKARAPSPADRRRLYYSGRFDESENRSSDYCVH